MCCSNKRRAKRAAAAAALASQIQNLNMNDEKPIDHRGPVGNVVPSDPPPYSDDAHRAPEVKEKPALDEAPIDLPRQVAPQNGPMPGPAASSYGFPGLPDKWVRKYAKKHSKKCVDRACWCRAPTSSGYGLATA